MNKIKVKLYCEKCNTEFKGFKWNSTQCECDNCGFVQEYKYSFGKLLIYLLCFDLVEDLLIKMLLPYIDRMVSYGIKLISLCVLFLFMRYFPGILLSLGIIKRDPYFDREPKQADD